MIPSYLNSRIFFNFLIVWWMDRNKVWCLCIANILGHEIWNGEEARHWIKEVDHVYERLQALVVIFYGINCIRSLRFRSSPRDLTSSWSWECWSSCRKMGMVAIYSLLRKYKGITFVSQLFLLFKHVQLWFVEKKKWWTYVKMMVHRSQSYIWSSFIIEKEIILDRKSVV